jgi:orotate phosphoribosyltransferase
MFNKKISSETAKILIETKCVDISLKKKFVLTSGKKSPIYCDCRRLISFPAQRKNIINFAVQKIRNENICKNLQNIAGGESAGIPFASFISQKINLPLSYIRKEKKKFGKNSQIEGIIKPFENVLLVEDLMTDGGSKIKFIESILDVKANIKAIFVVFNYGINLDYIEVKKKKIKVIHLATWQDVLQEYSYLKKLSKKDKINIEEFLKSIGVRNLKSST